MSSASTSPVQESVSPEAISELALQAAGMAVERYVNHQTFVKPRKKVIRVFLNGVPFIAARNKAAWGSIGAAKLALANHFPWYAAQREFFEVHKRHPNAKEKRAMQDEFRKVLYSMADFQEM